MKLHCIYIWFYSWLCKEIKKSDNVMSPSLRYVFISYFTFRYQPVYAIFMPSCVTCYKNQAKCFLEQHFHGSLTHFLCIINKFWSNSIWSCKGPHKTWPCWQKYWNGMHHETISLVVMYPIRCHHQKAQLQGQRTLHIP